MSLGEYLPKDDFLRMWTLIVISVCLTIALWISWSYTMDIIAMNYGYQQEVVERQDPDKVNGARKLMVVWRKNNAAEEKK